MAWGVDSVNFLQGFPNHPGMIATRKRGNITQKAHRGGAANKEDAQKTMYFQKG
jgi:hypothetical protein